MNIFDNGDKTRVIQEYVPGKQVTLAHLIANPVPELYEKLGLLIEGRNALGIMTITPSEASIIAADVATKTSNVSIGFIDRFSGSLVITGSVSSVKEALKEVIHVLCDNLKFTTTDITHS
ncbi:BMC domain-containing protein [Clostridium chauvoei]|uniref:BMC domain-containing protein n=2 Tax=Clostridium chauvoei TaxID=46867 RepID=A0ABD4RE99_9CLOT|nr:BMC domain-containing protein [Clostridium chauvoei]ATD55060.1 propanediol utilization protein [Clostridium chauvoei]ATD57266.1 propanediol utilization protein [Clostridium chauvoei]MBX7279403.1 BMC domain-containing protein [Clostridium chauvoei]MBX7282511.1 BMC domain-containing protein [Clostridium chauvoei]MBX7285601.1 BMC domain-containing protein [Clostridium chauvoei]